MGLGKGLGSREPSWRPQVHTTPDVGKPRGTATGTSGVGDLVVNLMNCSVYLFFTPLLNENLKKSIHLWLEIIQVWKTGG